MTDLIYLDVWYDFFRLAFSPIINTSSPLITSSNPILDSEITKVEICWSLRKYKDGKSPGPDGLPYEFFKNLPESEINYIFNLFNKVMSKEEVPDS